MAYRMMHQPNSPKLKELFVGAPSSEQKPSMCSRCGRPVGYRYRVYEESTDWKTGRRKIIRGQYEVAHIGIDGSVLFECEKPSMLDEIKRQIEDKIARGEWTDPRKARLESEEYRGKPNQTVHAINIKKTKIGEGGEVEGTCFVVCGAKGNLWTTLDNESVTCSNCLVRLKEAVSPSNEAGNTAGIETTETIKSKGEDTMSTTQEKIKAAQAKAAAKAAAAKGGDEGAPMPQATGKVKRQSVATPKVAKGPELLNLCGCGCGAGVKRKFAVGHDARFHGWIKKLEKGEMDLTTLAAQVRDGMFPKVKQTKTETEGKVTYSGVLPVVTEEDYLAKLVGKGGEAQAA